MIIFVIERNNIRSDMDDADTVASEQGGSVRTNGQGLYATVITKVE